MIWSVSENETAILVFSSVRLTILITSYNTIYVGAEKKKWLLAFFFSASKITFKIAESSYSAISLTFSEIRY